MPSTLPCPNPVCTHLFNADAVKGAASVVCPRCGTKLEFRRAPASPPARPPAPPAKKAAPKPPAAAPKAPAAVAPPAKRPPPVAPPPAAKPAAPSPPIAAAPAGPPVAQVVAAPAVPLATPVTAAAAAAPGLVFNSQPDMLLTAPRRRRGLPGWLIALFLVVGVFGGMAALIVGAMLLPRGWHSPGEESSGLAEEQRAFAQQGNFRLEPPGKPWERDTKAGRSAPVWPRPIGVRGRPASWPWFSGTTRRASRATPS